MATDELANLLKAGIQAAKDKNKTEARRLLQQVIERDDSNEPAWLWLAAVMDTPREQRICLENVLEINPNNARAREMLEKLKPSPITANPQSSAVSSVPRPSVNAPRPPKASNVPLTNKPLPNDRVRAAREAQVERARQPRRLTPLTFAIGVLLAIGLIAIGLLLLSSQPQNVVVVGSPTVTLANGTLALTRFPASAVPTSTIQPQDLFTGLPPTWTPQPTSTPRPSNTPTATLPPVTRYTLAYVGDGRGSKTPVIYTASGDGKDEKILINADGGVSDLAYSPNGAKIAYVAGTISASPQIAVADANGANPTTITSMKGKHVATPAWSPDGKKIAFISDDAGDDQLYIMSADGQGITRIADEKFPHQDPAWSPDGKVLVYAADPTKNKAFQLFQYDFKTNQVIQLTASQGSNTRPVFAPDSSRIAFVSTRGGEHDIYTMATDGSDENLITFDDNQAENKDPAYSPDSRYILFSSNWNGGIFNLFVTTPDAKIFKQISNATADTYYGRFRPNGS